MTSRSTKIIQTRNQFSLADLFPVMIDSLNCDNDNDTQKNQKDKEDFELWTLVKENLRKLDFKEKIDHFYTEEEQKKIFTHF